MKKKKARLLPLIAIACFPMVLMLIGLLSCFHVTGFSPSKIRSNLPFNSNWETDPLTEKQKTHLIQTVFPQKFYYFFSDTHCYAFISEDKNYIIKFFKSNSFSPKGWLSFYPISLLRHLGWSDRFDNQFFSEHVFASYKNAYESLRAESGLIYIHLNRNREFRTSISLIDAKGKTHLVELDTVEFILQKKAVPIFEHLKSLIQSHNLDKFKSSLRAFFQMIAIRCEKGFASPNVSLQNQFGFIGEQPIQFDCGLLNKDLSMKYPMNIQREILQAAERLNLWANGYPPEVAFVIQEEAQRIINQIF